MTESSSDHTTRGAPLWVKVFGIVGLVLAVLAILMLTGVLGKGHGPGRHLGGPAADQRTGGIGGPARAHQATRTVDVKASDTMAFAPSRVDVSTGEIVTFSVTNVGKTAHEFTLGDAAMQQEHAGMMAHMPSGFGHDTPNSITLEPGQTKHITWRFARAGTLEYGCHQRGHYTAGMRGSIYIS